MPLPYIDTKTFNKLVNYVIASSKINTIKTPIKSFPYIRPNIHAIIYGRIGSAKSTVLYEICNSLKILPTTLNSKAGLIGTVDKNTGMFIPPTIWEYKNNILPVDEYTFNHYSSNDLSIVDILNTILENPYISRKFGYRCNDFDDPKNNKDLYCKVKNSRLIIKTRFSLLMNTMEDLHKTQNKKLYALLTRCLILPLYPTLDDLKRKLEGEYLFKYQKINVNKNIIIKQKDWNYIKDFLYNKNIAEENYLRTFGEIVRIFAITKKHDENLYDIIIKIKSVELYKGHYDYRQK